MLSVDYIFDNALKFFVAIVYKFDNVKKNLSVLIFVPRT